MGLTGSPGARAHGSDTFLSDPWVRDCSIHVVNRMGCTRMSNPWASSGVIRTGDPGNVKPMGERNHAYSCVNRVGDTVMSAPWVCEAYVMESTAWVVQECPTHGRLVVSSARVTQETSNPWVNGITLIVASTACVIQ